MTEELESESDVAGIESLIRGLSFLRTEHEQLDLQVSPENP